MLTEEQKNIMKALVNDSLDKAEEHWKNGGHELLLASASLDIAEAKVIKRKSEVSKIPEHPTVQDDKIIIDEFVAFVADMRDSSQHLLCARSIKRSEVSDLQRVFYETSALLPSLAQTVKFDEGSVTEYLGDGVLALFSVDSQNKKEAIYAAHRAAKNAIGDTRKVVNEILFERYKLPNVDLGVGLAMSKSIVTLFGLEGEKHPKAFGECVFRATKLSSGRNEIHIDNQIRVTWPSEKGGILQFYDKKLNGVDGYLIGKAS
jgi:class 3 adenylate cyclase